MTEPQMPSELQRSSRDREAVRAALERALAGHIKDGTDHEVSEVEGTSSTGMSSETLLFTASWNESDGRREERLVARVAPNIEDVPVFQEYDLAGQFRTIQTVGSLTDVPVPPQWWCEPDHSVIGSPFFVMGRVDGEVPPDIMPYTFGDNWLYDGSRDEQRRLQDSTIAVLAKLAAIEEPQHRFDHLEVGSGDTALRRHLDSRWQWYQWAARESGRSTVVEKAFAWLNDRFPSDEGETVFSWGDSRIGNVMYRDFEPVAVLDWEMAGLGPRELDLGWLIYLHQMFQDLGAQFGMEGMPHFLRQEDAATTYEALSGHTARYLDWYGVYSCVQLGIVYLRTGMRSVRFGEREMPSDPDEFLINASALASLIS